jgi:NAD(P)-dependent dehydrogenase (short-subunit alcohol dehydrogenase family)
MQKQHYGKIVNMSSIAAKLGGANAAVYSATKAGVLELTACLAREYAQYNININCVLPGIIRTPLWENMLNEMTNNDESKKDEVFASFTKDIPLGKPQEPIDIANAVLFLCTEEANNITAQNLGVDGGQTY